MDFGVIDMIIRLAVAFFFCLLAAIVVSIISSYKTFKYTEKLSNAIIQASKGDFESKIDPNESTLFKDVIIAYNKMLDELNQTQILRSDFISNFSHECRTPINCICNYAELLTDDELSNEDKKEFISIIISESKRLNQLSDSVLQLTNIGTKTQYAEIESFRLDEILREILISKDKDLEKIDLKYDIANITIKAREIHIYQLFTNLINNAIKYTKSKIFISLTVDNNDIKFIISDDGIGMSENTINHIFDITFQADKSHNHGCGLGMSIVKKIIDFEKYKLDISSEIDKGSTFTLHLHNL